MPELMAAWRIKVVLSVPRGFVAAGPPDNPMERLEYPSRIEAEARAYGDIVVAIRKDRDLSEHAKGLNTEAIELVADVPDANGPESALFAGAPILESVVELLSFELGEPVLVGSVTVTDATPPIATGEDRAHYTLLKLPGDLSTPDDAIGGTPGVHGVPVARLPLSTDSDAEETAALRWFVKSLGAKALVDQFIFAWIALEILCDDSGVGVREPYRCRKGHVIERCPTCGARTEQKVRGATMRAFLVNGGMEEDDAKAAWRMRQIMHGAVSFESEALLGIGDLILRVRAVVAADLKARFGLTPEHLPIYQPTGLMLTGFGMSGTTKAEQDLIDPLT